MTDISDENSHLEALKSPKFADKQTYGQYLDALRVKLATAEETHERNHRVYVKYKIETDAEIKDLRAYRDELIAINAGMKGEIASLRAKLQRAMDLIGALCDELEDEITNNYKSMYGNPVHPAMQHRLDRDLSTAREARKFLRGEEECSEDRS